MSKKTNSGRLWSIIAVLIFILLLVFGQQLKDVLKPKVSSTEMLDENCDLRISSCSSKLADGGVVTLSIMPKDIPLLKPLKLSVKVDGIDISNAEVDFVGIGMDMGSNRSQLQLKTKQSFTGKAILPVCMRSKMEWEARVLLQTDKGILMVPFRFYTLRGSD